jgi:GLPGLI family protein
MIKRIFFVGILFMALTNFCAAQYLTKGKIQFERKINLQKQSDEISYQENLKRNNWQFKIDLFDLYFTNEGSFYSLTKADETIKFFNVPALNNVVVNDFRSKTKLSKKEIFDQNFMVKDTAQKIRWKYVGELREIAGYECKRAEAILFDSIYVVAFYSEQISISAGPESFYGLPGMILGLAIPKLNTTWWATKVEPMDVNLDSFQRPTKGTSTNSSGLKVILESIRSNWGSNGYRYFIWSII